MIKRILAGVAAGITVVLLATVPSFAGTYGSLQTLNPSGGTTASNGIKIDYAGGSIQVTRNGFQQIYPAQSNVDDDPSIYCATAPLPDPDNQGCVSSSFVVTLKYASNKIVIGAQDPQAPPSPAPAVGQYWDTITSESTVEADGSGTVHTVLTSANIDWCDNSCTGKVVLDVVMQYTYPNQFMTITTSTSWTDAANVGNLWKAYTYYYEDATLSGQDEGDQFDTTDAAGNTLAGVIRPDGTALEGVRSHADSPIRYYAGEYSCPLIDSATNCVPNGSGGWIALGENLPNEVDATTEIDNGFDVQSGNDGVLLNDLKTTPQVATYDLLFVACEVGSTAGTCIQQNASPALPDTGVDTGSMTAMVAGAAALAGLGIALVAIRRRRNA